MSSDVMLRASGVSKRYRIRHRAVEHVTLAESALHRLRHPLQRSEREDFWALSDVDLELARGEVARPDRTERCRQEHAC